MSERGNRGPESGRERRERSKTSQRAPAQPGRVNRYQRSALVQALARDGHDPQAASVDDVATTAVANKGSGAGVDPGVQARVGGHLGADFSGVRVHSDPLAQQASEAMGARAFAYQNDVFLGPGESGGDVKLMAHELTHVVQQGAAGQARAQRQVTVGAANSPAEAEADRVADAVTAGGRPAQLLVDDGTPAQPGQMTKSEFLRRLKPAVTNATDAALGPVWSAIGCPYIERYFHLYQEQSAAHCERVMTRFAPQTARAARAEDCIPILAQRAADGARQWSSTGSLPSDVAAAAPAGAQVAESTAAAARSPLGEGAPLDASTASRMTGAMGHDLGGVRIHTDANAARMAAEHDALAVTVGQDIAFAAGKYAPGSIEGDALLAHELAHTVQQKHADTTAPIGDTAAGSAHEEDADHAATGVLARLYGGARKLASRTIDVLSSGYQMARCESASEERTRDRAEQAERSGEAEQSGEAAGGGGGRGSAIGVVSAVQAFRPTFPDEEQGRVRLALMQRLRDGDTSVGDAVNAVGAGDRSFGTAPGGAEERAGTAVGSAAAGDGATRRAVVVGNGDYEDDATMGNTIEPGRDLPGSPGDASTIAGAFSSRGYNVDHQDNRTGPQINTMLTGALDAVPSGGELSFYYSGHGTIEGLIGVDGSVFTPAQAAALQTSARGKQVDFYLALDACHAGVFADTVRSGELANTREQLQQAAAGSGGSSTRAQNTTAVLDQAIAIQQAKDTFNTSVQQWWAQRYQVERDMEAANYSQEAMAAWDAHYQRARAIWQTFVTSVQPLLTALAAAATTAGMTVGSVTLTVPEGDWNNDSENHMQAQLDDVDSILNSVLTQASERT